MARPMIPPPADTARSADRPRASIVLVTLSDQRVRERRSSSVVSDGPQTAEKPLEAEPDRRDTVVIDERPWHAAALCRFDERLGLLVVEEPLEYPSWVSVCIFE